jgi:RNA polymerase sigma-70 factor, ECF subfamily
MQPDTRSHLALAAEPRSAGQTWEAVARRVGRDPSTCRRWPSRYRQDWEPLYRAAQKRGPGPAARASDALPQPGPPHVPELVVPPTATRKAVGTGTGRAGLPRPAAARRTDPHPTAAALHTNRTGIGRLPLIPPSSPATHTSSDNGWLTVALLLAAVAYVSRPAAPPAPTTPNLHEARLLLVHHAPANPEGPDGPNSHEDASAPAAPALTSHPRPTEMVGDAVALREPPPAQRRTGTRRPVPEPDPDRLSDEDLLSRFRRGQREVFGTLVRRYQRELYGYLRRYLGDPHLADDVFQTTFVQVFAKAAQYEPGRPVRPWLYAIATNQAIDALRRAGRHPAVSLEQTETEADGERRGLIDLLEAREADPFDNVDAAETRELVRACIGRLPDFLRQVLLMAYYQGLKYQEIADALDIPLGTVKSRLHAALVKLHEAWDEQVPSPSPVPSRDD